MKRPFLESFYNERLWDYFQTIWEDPSDYKVLMPRRMLNLNYGLMQEWNIEDDEQYYTDEMMSSTAFLLAAKDIANQYIYTRCFPDMLICDDIMLHGRAVLRLLNSFKRIVLNHLEENNVDITESRLDIDLYSAVKIYIFARNKDEGMLIDERKYRLYSALVLPVDRLRELSSQISYFLQDCGTPNTSYVLSAKLTWEQIQRLDIGVNAFSYMQREQSVFFRDRCSHVLETMRLHYSNNTPELGGFLTSLPIFEDISIELFDKTCKNIADFVEETSNYNRISEYLRQDDAELVNPKAQLLSFIYSAVSLADFCRQYLSLNNKELLKILLSGDFEKILSNFDKDAIFKYEILSLFEDICGSTLTCLILWICLEQAIASSNEDLERVLSRYKKEKFRYINSLDRELRQRLYEKAEEIFYEVGMDAEYEAYDYVRNKRYFDVISDSVDLITLDNYKKYMETDKQDQSTGCLFGLMDIGLVAMNLKPLNTGNNQVIQTVLKAGEMATYVLPKRFSVFMPAFSIVERYCGRRYMHSKNIIRSFIDFLSDHCYQQSEKEDPRDRYLLNSLKRLKESLLRIYDVGQSFEDWDINLRNDNKQLTTRFAQNTNSLSYEEEWIRKKYYQMVAKLFIRQVVMGGSEKAAVDSD